MAKKGGLGRGLDALFSENSGEEQSAVEVRLSEIEPNREQPRKDFDQEALAQLAESIREHGLIQPILVRPLPGGTYQIVAGERRWRASRLAGLTAVPVIIRELDDTAAMELALIENLQREDLNPVEEALGYKTLMEDYGMTQELAAQRVGKSRPAVANALRLLNLPEKELTMVRSGEISAGHGRALLSISEPELYDKAVKMAKAGMSVREIEKLSKAEKKAGEKKTAEGGVKDSKRPTGDTFYSELELALKAELGRKVRILKTGRKGTLEIEFYDKEDLASIASRLAGTEW